MRWLRHDLAACASTNDEAMQRARAGAPHGTVVVADEQTAGRGRLARAWSSCPGDLMASIVVRGGAGSGPGALAGLPLVVGVAVASAARALGAPAQLKWPNDVGVVAADGGFRKLGGILVEGVGVSAGDEQGPAVVVGIGLNVVAADAARPAELRQLATSIEALAGRRSSRDEALAAVLSALAPELASYLERGLETTRERWHDLMAPLARVRHATASGVIEGVPLGLAGDGGLLIQSPGGDVHHVLAGDVVAVPRGAP